MFATILRHRVDVVRASESVVGGVKRYTWATIATDVPVFLSVDVEGQVEGVGRSGLLLTDPATYVEPGDRLRGTRGVDGTWVVGDGPGPVAHTWGVHHREWRVTAVPHGS